MRRLLQIPRSQRLMAETKTNTKQKAEHPRVGKLANNVAVAAPSRSIATFY
jgi:hypothetical protein